MSSPTFFLMQKNYFCWTEKTHITFEKQYNTWLSSFWIMAITSAVTPPSPKNRIYIYMQIAKVWKSESPSKIWQQAFVFVFLDIHFKAHRTHSNVCKHVLKQLTPVLDFQLQFDSLIWMPPTTFLNLWSGLMMTLIGSYLLTLYAIFSWIC